MNNINNTNLDLAVWFSTPSLALGEIAKNVGYRTAVLDIEHGNFDLADLERFVPALKWLGFKVYAKVLGPFREAIQQGLDFGADGVIIPHIEGEEHARKVCGFSKFPPLGDRSSAGGRTQNYGMADDAWFKEQDIKTKCFPMIEDAGAFAEVEKILALDCVDGIFIGPTDLSLRRERGSYKRSAGDWDDLAIIAEAANRAGKPWIFPAWSEVEKRFALDKGAATILLTMEHIAISAGLNQAWDQMQSVVREAERGSQE
ncbi:4-hydroxy-2-oxovalerate aldolase [Pantoea sp. Ap-967]|uniref:HpcH/HpaI aldolase family protein n=1 Tax=Pantoea sp. Ap-967 TaxID=2608362 RepID=UPI0014222566|nr:aldolase/citrate lyase family protein [Pantoea sp. Ap-967]NIE78032.1 4-hydroxy-2-oxovalerate aldolase [Pantoea sp. Ap-967]